MERLYTLKEAGNFLELLLGLSSAGMRMVK